jgi:hypothetical protein
MPKRGRRPASRRVSRLPGRAHRRALTAPPLHVAPACLDRSARGWCEQGATLPPARSRSHGGRPDFKLDRSSLQTDDSRPSGRIYAPQRVRDRHRGPVVDPRQRPVCRGKELGSVIRPVGGSDGLVCLPATAMNAVNGGRLPPSGAPLQAAPTPDVRDHETNRWRPGHRRV